jgi:hypothetical protein
LKRTLDQENRRRNINPVPQAWNRSSEARHHGHHHGDDAVMALKACETLQGSNPNLMGKKQAEHS